MIHEACLAIKLGTSINVLRDPVVQFPTFSQAYLTALENLEP